MVASVIMIGGWMVEQAHWDVASFSASLALIRIIFKAVQTLIKKAGLLLRAALHLTWMVEALNLSSFHEARAIEQDAAQSTEPPPPTTRIAFRGLGLRHRFHESWDAPPTLGRWTLRPASGHFDLGGFLFLRGSTDLGRRAFLHLVARAVPPECGALEMPRQLKVCLVDRPPQLMRATLLDNLRTFASAKHVPDEEVWQVARAAGLSDELCGHAEIRLEPSGDGLSSDDRMAIGVARAILARPDVILLQGVDRAVCHAPHESPRWLALLASWHAAPERKGGWAGDAFWTRTVLVDAGGGVPDGAASLLLTSDEDE